MLVRWWLVDDECKRRMWLLYGWFNALMCCGSCFGAVAWAYQMQYLVAFYTPTGTLTSAENASLRAHADRSGAVFLVSYAIEFLCHSVAKLMVLNRLMRLSVPQGELLPESWTRGSKFVMAFVIVGNLVGLGSNVAAAVYSMQNADFASAASVAFAKNNTEEAMYFVGLTDEKFHVTLMSVSVQSFCEVAVLLLIISAFVLAGAMFASYASGMLRDLALAANGNVDAIRRVDEFSAVRCRSETKRLAALVMLVGQKHLRQVMMTVCFVFATLLLRAVNSTMYAFGNALQNDNARCAADAGKCDVSCFNLYSLMQTWLIYTPEFQLIVVLISSPLALLVALWGMTTDNMMKLMFRRRKVAMQKILLK
jgi:hypothetical protein